MFSIILKIILCSSLLITVYYFFLEKEKMYRFNRFFLLFSLAFSYLVPFISITTELPKPIDHSKLVFEESTQQALNLSLKQENFNWATVIWIVYGSITLAFLIKALISMLQLKSLKGKKIDYQNYRIVITQANLPPFSFWNTIYMGENYLSNNEIDPRIFLHEKSHLDEKHTWDLLFIEVVKVFTWFNPALYFYKRAMITNHEFLADEAVINHNFSIRDYQNLIIKEITDNQGLAFTHPFNFNNTKKRFIMMNTKKSKLIGIKKIASIPILITAFGLFVQKTYAYNPTSNPESITTQTKTFNETPLTESLVKTDGQKDITNHRKIISDTIRPTTKSAAKKTTRNKDVLVPPSPTQGSKSENTNTNQNADTPPPPAPSASFVQADFPQGINEFRNRLAKNFNGSIFKGNEGLVRTNVFISINSDGTVQKITANGDNSTFNEEAERTVKTVTQNVKWTPATNNGQPVATVFKIPLTMSFDNGKK